MAARKSASETTEAKQVTEMEGQKEPAEEKKEPAEEQEEEEKKEPAEEPKRYMYVGPTVPGIGIQNRVYTDIPQEVVDIMNNGHPVIGDLFIQIRDYPVANRMIRERKGYLYNAYLTAEKIRVENAKKAENTFTGGEDTEERGVIQGGERAWHIYIRRGYGPYNTKRIKRRSAGGDRDRPGKYGGRPGIRG